MSYIKASMELSLIIILGLKPMNGGITVGVEHTKEVRIMQFRFSITADRYPTEYTVEASNWATATARALRLWKTKAGKGSRSTQISIKGWKINHFDGDLTASK